MSKGVVGQNAETRRAISVAFSLSLQRAVGQANSNEKRTHFQVPAFLLIHMLLLLARSRTVRRQLSVDMDGIPRTL